MKTTANNLVPLTAGAGSRRTQAYNADAVKMFTHDIVEVRSLQVGEEFFNVRLADPSSMDKLMVCAYDLPPGELGQFRTSALVPIEGSAGFIGDPVFVDSTTLGGVSLTGSLRVGTLVSPTMAWVEPSLWRSKCPKMWDPTPDLSGPMSLEFLPAVVPAGWSTYDINNRLNFLSPDPTHEHLRVAVRPGAVDNVGFYFPVDSTHSYTFTMKVGFTGMSSSNRNGAGFMFSKLDPATDPPLGTVMVSPGNSVHGTGWSDSTTINGLGLVGSAGDPGPAIRYIRMLYHADANQLWAATSIDGLSWETVGEEALASFDASIDDVNFVGIVVAVDSARQAFGDFHWMHTKDLGVGYSPNEIDLLAPIGDWMTC